MTAHANFRGLNVFLNFHLDENEDTRHLGSALKKRHLDPVLEAEPASLIGDFKDPDELLRLYDRVIDLEEEIVAKMEFSEGVKAIEGAKVDGQALWLLVRWENDKRSFVPSQIVRKIAPNKLLHYYESRVTFAPDPTKKGLPVGTNSLIEGARNNSKVTQDKYVPPPPSSKPQGPFKKPPTPSHPTINHNAPKPIPIQQGYGTCPCKGCKILLQFPMNTIKIRCPRCQTMMTTDWNKTKENGSKK